MFSRNLQPAARHLVALLAATALILGSPAAGEAFVPAVPTAPAKGTDIAHSSPENVIRMLTLRVNNGQRKLARNWATEGVVKTLFANRAKGYRLDRLNGRCPYSASSGSYECGVGLLQRGDLVGGVYLSVRGPRSNLRVVRAVAALGERTSAAPRTITYPGNGVAVWRLGNDLPKLTGTSPAFKRFVNSQLEDLWRSSGRDPQCEHSPLVQVKRFTKGYAQISNIGIFPHAGDPASCARGGSGAIAANWKGRWQIVLGTQDGYRCSELRRFRVPRAIGGPTCYDSSGNTVTYQP